MPPPFVLLRLPFSQNQIFVSTPKPKIARAIISSARKASEYLVNNVLSVLTAIEKIYQLANCVTHHSIILRTVPPMAIKITWSPRSIIVVWPWGIVVRPVLVRIWLIKIWRPPVVVRLKISVPVSVSVAAIITPPITRPSIMYAIRITTMLPEAVYIIVAKTKPSSLCVRCTESQFYASKYQRK